MLPVLLALYTVLAVFPLTDAVDTNSSSDGGIIQPVSNVESARVNVSKCSTPVETIANGVYQLSSDSSIVTYVCNANYHLLGLAERHCLPNQTWSGEAPQCVASFEFTEATEESPLTVLWSQTYVEHQKWQGTYSYGDLLVPFSFQADVAEANHVEALFRDGSAVLELNGFQVNQTVVFNTTKVVESSDKFPADIEWHVLGMLAFDNDQWTYTGNIISSQHGFGKLIMSPTTGEVQSENSVMELVADGVEDDDAGGEAPSAMAMIVGISMALVAILFAGVLAAFCVHRNGVLRLQGHQTLTSFENPIYDCENVLK